MTRGFIQVPPKGRLGAGRFGDDIGIFLVCFLVTPGNCQLTCAQGLSPTSLKPHAHV